MTSRAIALPLRSQEYDVREGCPRAFWPNHYAKAQPELNTARLRMARIPDDAT